MKNDWRRIEQSKRALSRRLSELPYADKLRLLDRMRERDLAIKNAKPIDRRLK